MVTSETSREQAILENLRERYEGKGYAFFAYPPRDLLPPFLEGYMPDAIALGPNERVAIEVKPYRGQANPSQLSKVASLFSGHPEWKFIVVYSDENARQDMLLSQPSRRDVESELSTVETLMRQGQTRAALVLAWGALEAAARLLVSPQDRTSHGRSPRQVLEQLERDGYLDRETARPLWEAVALRNAAVHGDFAAEIGDTAIEQLLAAIRELLKRSPASAQANA